MNVDRFCKQSRVASSLGHRGQLGRPGAPTGMVL